MGSTNFIEERSAKEASDALAARQKAGTEPDDKNALESKDIKKTLGYVDGYSNYTTKYGGPVDGTMGGPRTGEKIRTPEIENPKPDSFSNQVNTQINKFRNIFGYGSQDNNGSDGIEDPTFIVFDLQMDYAESPLFNSVTDFINEYSDSTPELVERVKLYEQFTGTLFKIFPGNSDENSGYKRHYVNSISGLDNLFKKIVNYPDDVISFTLSEDITMIAQYISELYSNLVYSYDTHRYLIPDNLLRFNLTIFFSDVRDIVSSVIGGSNIVNENVSKFAYVLHDCQFNFFNSRNFGSDITVSGFEGGATNTPSTLSFNINYKSYSKIMLPNLIDDSTYIDLRERIITSNDDADLARFNNDYDVGSIQLEKTQAEREKQSIPVGTLPGKIDSVALRHPGGTGYEYATPGLGDKIKNAFTDEISDVRNVLVNKIKEEVTVLSSRAQKFVSDKIFGGLNIPGFNGITLTKVNVYYDDPFQALDKVSFLLERFIDNSVEDIKKNIKLDVNTQANKGDRVNIYWGNTNVKDATWKGVGEDLKDIAEDAFFGNTGAVPRDSNVYSNNLENGKVPTGENRYGYTDLNPDGQYNEKYPSGSVQDKGIYNEKYPDGDVNPDGTYNEKYPSGTVQPKGAYNEKYPEGDKHPDGAYNEKYPEGDVNPDGTYNEKYPNGRVQPDGQYNEKYPSGSVQGKGTYNEKYPEGDLQPGGTYNEKYPEGDVQPDGEYNQKYPTGGIDGDLHVDGTYHDKEPRGEVYSVDDLEKGDKKPSGNVYGKKEEKEAETPEGDLHPDGQYNEKYPKGNLYKKDDDK